MRLIFTIIFLSVLTACGDNKEAITPTVVIEPSELNCNENIEEVLDSLKSKVAIDSFINKCEKYKKNKKAMDFNLKTNGNKISNY